MKAKKTKNLRKRRKPLEKKESDKKTPVATAGIAIKEKKIIIKLRHYYIDRLKIN